MPQPGETKTVNGVTGRWDGSTWRKVQAAPEQHPLDAGLNDSPLWASLKGGVKGAMEAATPTKLSLLAGLLTGGASIPIQAGAAAGASMLGGLAGKAAGSPDAPESFGDLVLGGARDAALVPAGIGVAKAAKHIPRVAGKIMNVAQEFPGWAGGGMVKAARQEAEPALSGAWDWVGDQLTRKRSMGNLGGDVQSVTDDVGSYIPNRSAYTDARPPIRSTTPPPSMVEPAAEIDRYMPNVGSATPTSGLSPQTSRVPYSLPDEQIATPAGPAPRLNKQSAPSLEDTLNDALKGFDSNVTPPIGTTPRAPHVARTGDLYSDAVGVEGPKPAFDWPELGGRMEPDATGSHKLQFGRGDTPDLTPEEFNVLKNSPYGYGAVVPGPMPTERANLGMLDDYIEPKGVYYNEGKVQGFAPEFSFEGSGPLGPDDPLPFGGAVGGELPPSMDLADLPNVRQVDALEGSSPAKPSIIPEGAQGISRERLQRILKTFTDPATETPFDKDLLELILQDPNGAEFAKAYGPSGQR